MLLTEPALTGVAGHGASPVVANPAVDAAPAGEHPQDVLESEVFPEAHVQDLRARADCDAVMLWLSVTQSMSVTASSTHANIDGVQKNGTPGWRQP